MELEFHKKPGRFDAAPASGAADDGDGLVARNFKVTLDNFVQGNVQGSRNERRVPFLVGSNVDYGVVVAVAAKCGLGYHDSGVLGMRSTTAKALIRVSPATA